jgi:4-alpha-glucanotransferase
MTRPPVRWRRAGGVLLHPTSLPGPFGIGDLGPVAERWIDWLSDAGCRLWQMLPLGPVGADASPYQSSSAFAGNTLLISPEKLVQDGLLSDKQLTQYKVAAGPKADFRRARRAKRDLVEMATRSFLDGAAPGLHAEAEDFFDAAAPWLDDFTLFRVLRSVHDDSPWHAWPRDLAAHDPKALAAFAEAHGDALMAEKVQQFFFERQWSQLHQRAGKAGIDIIGDIAIFVAHDSADVWAHRDLFKLDAKGMPKVVAGVPPDYFSATGQRWGNPHYDWRAMRANGYAWWIARLRRQLSQVDRVRVDHFRGFEAAWEIPAAAPTAEKGEWSPGPGDALFKAAEASLGALPIIAEDLGFITPDVEALRDELGFPGMRVLQFAFGGDPNHPYLPHRYPTNCVAYTGTHDNDTTCGWYESASEPERVACRRYLHSDGKHIAWDLTRAIWGSVADSALVPLQDLLELGTGARMNTPGTTGGNWGWRALETQLTPQLAERVKRLNQAYER